MIYDEKKTSQPTNGGDIVLHTKKVKLRTLSFIHFFYEQAL